MPANLTPQYHDAEEKFKQAASPEEKMLALEEMLRQIPKHKGTEKMQADLKKKLAQLRRDSARKTSAPAARPFHYVAREGAGRVVLCGPPNAGKSQLLSVLTEARPEVAPYPFTTRIPKPGMLSFEDVQIQLVDTPPLAPEVLESWQLPMIAQADVAALLFDVNDPAVLDQTEFVLDLFLEKGLSLKVPADSSARPRVLVLGNKVDVAAGMENFSTWQELFLDRFEALPFSTLSEAELAGISRLFFKALGLVRVYTKRPGEKPGTMSNPFLLPEKSTVLDAAAAVHQDLAEQLKYARLWRGHEVEGLMVERQEVLQDRDLIELHTR